MPRSHARNSAAPGPAAVRRCAIYTRKSSEEGLEQDFNSLHAQRDACEAFIASQRHEGWRCLPTQYDDGGLSGGTLERPALQQLLADIEAGKVDLVVVYKVDRLTRSLAGFAKIVDVFDAHGTSFVSVTQQFNTATSMGRLTLNMLLSFAQFEREVTGERIRDKIAASKRKGLWMGGLPPLGYDVRERKLVVNEAEAATVQHIYRAYLAAGSVRVLKAQLDREGVTTKIRPRETGPARGGRPLSRGNLYHMLQNRLYLGEVAHAGGFYPGEHAAIIDRALWDQVQALLSRTGREPGRTHHGHPSLLAGLVYDAEGTRLVATHATTRGRRYRYYVSEQLIRGPRSETEMGWRIPASDLEQLVTIRLLQLLGSASEMAAALEGEVGGAPGQRAAIARARELAQGWPSLGLAEQQRMLAALVSRVQVHADRVAIALRPGSLGRLDAAAMASPLADSDDTKQSSTAPPSSLGLHEPRPGHCITVPASLRRAGLEMRLVIDGPGRPAAPNATLIQLLARAHRMRARLLGDPNASLSELSDAESVTRSYFTRVLRLAFLAPDITAAILDGQQPPGLTASALLQHGPLPLAWDQQRAVLGFT